MPTHAESAAARRQAEVLWEAAVRRGNQHGVAASTLYKEIGVLSKGTWTQWARARRKQQRSDTTAIGNTRVQLLRPFVSTFNDVGARRGPHPANMRHKNGRKRKLTAKELTRVKDGIRHGSDRTQATWAGVLSGPTTTGGGGGASASAGATPSQRITQRDVSRATTRGKRRRGRRRMRSASDRGDIAVDGDGRGQGPARISWSKRVSKHPTQWIEGERDAHMSLTKLYDARNGLAFDETHTDSTLQNSVVGAAPVGKAATRRTDEQAKYSGTGFGACWVRGFDRGWWDELSDDEAEFSDYEESDRTGEGSYCGVEINLAKCSMRTGGKACHLEPLRRNHVPCRTKRALAAGLRTNQAERIAPATYIGKDKDLPVYCGGGGTERYFLWHLEKAIQRWQGLEGRPARALTQVGGDDPSMEDYKSRLFCLLDKSSLHVNHKEERTDLVAEQYFDKVFKGMPKEKTLELCKHYGVDVIVIPTRSYDYDPEDCGMFAAQKAWMRRQSWPTKTAKGLTKRWKRGAEAVHTPQLIHHCWKRAGWDL